MAFIFHTVVKGRKPESVSESLMEAYVYWNVIKTDEYASGTS